MLQIETNFESLCRQLGAKVGYLETENASLTDENQKLLDWQDLSVRTVSATGMSYAYKLVYLAMVDAYPLCMLGEKVFLNIEIIQNGACVSKSTVQKFFQDMAAANACFYTSDDSDKIRGNNAYVVCNPDVFPYPEIINTRDVEKRRQAREAELKKQKEFRHALQITKCEKCGSPAILNDVIPRCDSCGYIHETIKNIPPGMITISVEVVELGDEQPPTEDEIVLAINRPTQRSIYADTTLEIPIVRVPARALPETPIPECVKPLPPMPDKFCVLCGRPRRECWVPSAAPGLWDFSCSYGKRGNL